MIACVAFDFDGTLVDSNQVKVQAFYEIVKGYDPSGGTVTEVLRQCSNEDRYGITRELAREFTAKGLIPPDSDVKVIAAQWAEAYTSACETAITRCREIPGTSECLTWLLNKKIPLFINSRTPIGTLSRLLALRNLRHYFSGIYGAPASKLENLRHIQELTRAKPDEILFVGDSEDDRMAAAALGCHFAGVILGDSIRFGQLPPVHVKNLGELRGIMGNTQENRNSLPQTIERLPAPFNRESFSFLQQGIFDSNGNDV